MRLAVCAFLRLAMGLALLGAAAMPAASQTATPDAPGGPKTLTSAILVVDQDEIYGRSEWGKRVEKEVAEASAALTAENRKIEADLSDEEKSLTARRASMAPDAFRSEADAFDEKVVAIRAARDAKARDIGLKRDSERQAFFSAALPYFAAVMRERSAVAILDKRTVFLSANSVDVTEDMIRIVNTQLGAGPKDASVPPQPEATPPPAPAATP